ncbi:unnamed protein product [Clavelina lepadiformis]|uniref:Sushi domain-containing protein n=1 Tax=Clavelina lepadiformis TaxID=159417 RepID=A0ABP0GBY9_CLALP
MLCRFRRLKIAERMRFFLICSTCLMLTRVHGLDQVDDIDDDYESLNDFATHAVKDAIRKVNRAVKRTKLKWEKKDVWDDPMTLFQFFKRPPSEESAKMAMAGDIFQCALDMVQNEILDHHPTRFKRRVNATDVLSQETIMELARFSGCTPNLPPPECSDGCMANMYRTYNGMCNNERNPSWGAGNLPLARWLDSQYENDFSTPIGWNRDRLYNSYRLPMVRKVSNDVIAVQNSQVTGDPDYSHMIVVWGQYIDHDMDLTPQSLSTSTFQGLTDCKTTCENKSPCYPMQVPDDDQRITDVQCLPFFRSAAVCGTGDTSSLFYKLKAREQINAATSFVDGSAVYGSSEGRARNLRDLTNEDGLMRVNDRFRDEGNREYLPFDPSMPCVQDQFDASGENINCFMAGDPRSSEHLTLTSLHTLWVREHNRIARSLKRLNPHWSGETLYQEARKIAGAYHQVVHWKEYVPKIIGPNGITQMGDYDGYKSDENPTISNVFATAAFRFGHVTISPEFRRLDENYNDHPDFPSMLLHQAFFSPWRMIRQGGMDPILRGLIGRPAKLPTPSQIMHEELREKLFALQNRVALDLASLNLQRGRDHALPLYNDWREECGLPRANNFSQVANEIKNDTIRDKLEELYGHPGNIDIWMAGLAEDLEDGSRLGPTFTCLLSRQFKFLRNGDKFYYENPGVFTEEQRTALNRMTFARVLCDNSGLTRVQRDVFRLATFPRDFVDCSEIPMLDLSRWTEDSRVGSCGTPPNIDNGSWRKCGTGVTYFCKKGHRLNGASEIRCNNGRFNFPPPSCAYIDVCDTNNGGCEDLCTSSEGTVTCRCNSGRRLMGDGRKCQDIPNTMNVAAVAVGVVFGVAIVAVSALLAVVFYKFTKLRTETKYRRTGRYSLNDTSNVYDNPAMKPTPIAEKANL